MSDQSDSFEFLQLKAALLLAGCIDTTVRDIERIVREISKGPSGYRRLGKSLKLWKSTTVDVLAGKRFTGSISHEMSHSRVLSRSRHILKRVGWSDQDIQEAMEFHGKRKIPPFLLDPNLCDALKVNPSIEVLRRLVPLANISRTGPNGGRRETDDSLSRFRQNVTRTPLWSFDLRGPVSRMLSNHSFRGSNRSRWEVSQKSSRGYPRSSGGKIEEFIDSYVMDFRLLPVSEFISELPRGNVYDITGTLVLREGEYNLDDRFSSVAYPDVGLCTDELSDFRLGHLGLFWALHELRSLDLEFEADEDFQNLGVGRKPTLRIRSGSIPARVAPVPEAGLKVRIITITEFFVALIGSVSRHCVDESLDSMDEFIRIGLKSKVKLYDFLVILNGRSHRGVSDSTQNALVFRSSVSVDLTTATDTPPAEVKSDVLHGVADSISSDNCSDLFRLGVDLAVLPRSFEMPDSSIITDHKCGIMMGEGLSGIFLNICSAFVRFSVSEFRLAFPDLHATTVDAIDEFIMRNVEAIQNVLDQLDFTSPTRSIQSGDDMSALGEDELSAHLFLLYRIFQFLPSEDSWHESSQFVTFTEEIALNTADSGGWTFIDTVKPRLFRCLDAQGEDAVVSRIKQIGDSLRYLGDSEIRDRMIPLVDTMISSCPSVSRVVRSLNIPVGFPSWLGGIGHPIGDEPLYLLEVDQRYRNLLTYLRDADDEVLADIFCVSLAHDPDKDGTRYEVLSISVNSMLCGAETDRLDMVSGTSWIHFQSLDLPRLPGEKYSHWVARKREYAVSEGLTSLSDFCQWYQSVTTVQDTIAGSPAGDVPVALRLRRRQEFLFSHVPDSYDCDPTISDEDIFKIYKGIKSQLESRLWKKEHLIQSFGLETLPSFSVNFGTLGTSSAD